MSYYGYTGKWLDIDLTTGTWSITEISSEILSRYIGGKGLAANREIIPSVSWDLQLTLSRFFLRLGKPVF